MRSHEKKLLLWSPLSIRQRTRSDCPRRAIWRIDERHPSLLAWNWLRIHYGFGGPGRKGLISSIVNLAERISDYVRLKSNCSETQWSKSRIPTKTRHRLLIGLVWSFWKVTFVKRGKSWRTPFTMLLCPFNSCCALISRAKSKLHNFDEMICRTLGPVWTQLFLWMPNQEGAVISRASLYIYFSFLNHGLLQSQTTRSSNSITFCLNIITYYY